MISEPRLVHTHTLPFPRALGLIAAFDSFTVERSIHASDKRELFFLFASTPRLNCATCSFKNLISPEHFM